MKEQQTTTGSSTPTSISGADPLIDLRENIKHVNQLMIGVVIFIAVSFLVAYFLLNSDAIKEKDVYLKYNDLYQSYSEKNSSLNDKINEQLIEINNLKNDIQILKARNPYLK